jgi:hypothetical protein
MRLVMMEDLEDAQRLALQLVPTISVQEDLSLLPQFALVLLEQPSPEFTAFLFVEMERSYLERHVMILHEEDVS